MNLHYDNSDENINKYRNTALVSLIVLIALIFSFFAKIYRSDITSEVSADERIFIIDAGHGGEDPGTSSKDGILEKDLNLQISIILGEMLTDNGYTVVYTRTDDKLLYNEDQNIKGLRKISDLKNRCNLAESYPDAVFLSIHMNSYGSSKYSGLQVYYGIKDPRSEILAECIQANVKREVQNENRRKIKKGNNIYLMENIGNVCVLIECGFLSNVDEAKKLSEKEYQKILCFSIFCGIIEYISVTDGGKIKA